MSSLDFHLQPATADDLDRLFEIHCRAMRSYVDAVWGWGDAWQEAHFREHFDPSVRQAICRGDRAIGFLDVIRLPDSVFLQSIEIDPEHQGGGIGTELIRGVIAEADAVNLPVRLQVLRVNERARNLYARLGFVQVAGTETHLAMERPCATERSC